jgi:hypothetical protein
LKFLLEIEGGIDEGRFTGEGRKILQWRGRRGNIRENSELLKQPLPNYKIEESFYRIRNPVYRDSKIEK